MTHIFTVHIRWHISDVTVVPFLLAFPHIHIIWVHVEFLIYFPVIFVQAFKSLTVFHYTSEHFMLKHALWPFSYWSILVFFIFLLRISVPQHSVSGNRSTFIIKVYYHHGYIGNLNNVFMIIVVMWCHQWVTMPSHIWWHTKTFVSTVSSEIYTSGQYMDVKGSVSTPLYTYAYYH